MYLDTDGKIKLYIPDEQIFGQFWVDRHGYLNFIPDYDYDNPQEENPDDLEERLTLNRLVKLYHENLVRNYSLEASKFFREKISEVLEGKDYEGYVEQCLNDLFIKHRGGGK